MCLQPMRVSVGCPPLDSGFTRLKKKKKIPFNPFSLLISDQCNEKESS